MQLTVEKKHRHKSIYRDVGIEQVENQGPALRVLEEMVTVRGWEVAQWVKCLCANLRTWVQIPSTNLKPSVAA